MLKSYIYFISYFLLFYYAEYWKSDGSGGKTRKKKERSQSNKTFFGVVTSNFGTDYDILLLKLLQFTPTFDLQRSKSCILLSPQLQLIKD